MNFCNNRYLLSHFLENRIHRVLLSGHSYRDVSSNVDVQSESGVVEFESHITEAF